MGWKDILSKLRIIDMSAELEGEQQGVLNIKIENHTYNVSVPGVEAAQAFSNVHLTPAIEELIKKEVERKLAPLNEVLNRVSDGTALELIQVSTGSSALSVSKNLSVGMDAVLENEEEDLE